MRSNGREIKWAVCGCLGGFLFCYLLVGAFRAQPISSPPPLVKAVGNVAWPVLPAPPVVAVTNLKAPELRVELPPRWVGPSWELPSEIGRPGYFLDLIDTHYQPPASQTGQ